MKHVKIVAGLVALSLIPAVALAQTARSAAARTATQVAIDLVAGSEKQLTGVATEMPEGKYEFAPTEEAFRGSAFRGVRSFAKQIKHAAAVNHLIAATILGEPITADMSDEQGPDAAKTKADVLQYLKDSFAALRRAAATVDEKNAFASIKGPFGSAPETRLGLIVLAVSHSSNHYGQVVEYLRMNGIVPPGSQ
jgi:uncharacterized damage-inducible protein DinB